VRLAIISDTHMPRGARRLPRLCVEQLEAADAILHCGDLSRVEILEQLLRYGPPVHAIRGNVDDESVCRRLPDKLEVELAGARIGMVHDPGPRTGRLRRLSRFFPRTNAVVFGHTHMPEHEVGPDGFQIFNPGSPTERRRAPAHTMGIGTIEHGTVEFELLVVA
jgi:putative phosphoesterase